MCRKAMPKYVFCLVSLLLLLSCTDESIDLPEDESQLVVEGWIEDGGFPVVLLTRSLPVSSQFQQADDLSDYLVRWAKVTVSDGTSSVVLTGKYDQGYYPPYIYTSTQIRGQAGKRYTLTAEYRHFKATASTTVPAPPDSCSFSIEKCAGSDTLYQIKAAFTDQPSQKNYYQFFSRVGTATRQYLACYMGSIDDTVLSGPAVVTVYRGHELQVKKYSPYFSLNDTVMVKFAQVDETSFRVWDSYTKSLSLSGNMFLTTSSNMFSNVSGGYGYWCGYGAITKAIVVRDSVLEQR